MEVMAQAETTRELALHPKQLTHFFEKERVLDVNLFSLLAQKRHSATFQRHKRTYSIWRGSGLALVTVDDTVVKERL